MEQKLGITENKAGFHSSLSSIGKSDDKGQTIAISYVSGTALRFIPLIVRIVIFLLLFVLPFYSHPFSALPDFPGAPDWYIAFKNWEAFTLVTWALGVLIYIVYFVFTLVVKNGLYRGVPGAEIHFTRYGKIVYTVRPGEVKLIIDPRVKPYAVVSTRIMTMPMPIVENNTRDNMTLRFRGTLVFRVNDTLKLLQAGGFKSFVRQLGELYTSRMRDEIQKVDAKHFNKFYVEPVGFPNNSSGSIIDLSKLSSNTDLSVEMLEGLAEIDELDISKLGLVESATPERRNIISRLQQLAAAYGVEILDHVPDGNRTSDEYLHTLALPLVSSITRLTQATEVLRGIRQSEIEVGIQNHVASSQMLLLEISKIIKAIQSVTRTLESEDNKKKLTESRKMTMLNTSNVILTTQVAKIDGLLSRVKAGGVDLASVELLVRTMEEALTSVQKAVQESLPVIDIAVVSELNGGVVIPDVNVVGELFEKTGLKKALEELEKAGDGKDHKIDNYDKEVEGFDVGKTITAIETALDGVSSDTGLSTSQWSPESVEKMITDLEREAVGHTSSTTATAVV